MSAPTDSAMLDWIAVYLIEIESYDVKGIEQIAVKAGDGDEIVHVVHPTGDDVSASFRKCLVDAMTALTPSELPDISTTNPQPRTDTECNRT